MHYRKLFNSPYLSAIDIESGDRNVTIVEVRQETVKNQSGEEICPVLFFNEFTKGLVMNKTNAKRIAAMYGTETENWKGKSLTLYPSEANFGNEVVPCIRVRANAPVVVAAVVANGAPAPAVA